MVPTRRTSASAPSPTMRSTARSPQISPPPSAVTATSRPHTWTSRRLSTPLPPARSPSKSPSLAPPTRCPWEKASSVRVTRRIPVRVCGPTAWRMACTATAASSGQANSPAAPLSPSPTRAPTCLPARRTAQQIIRGQRRMKSSRTTTSCPQTSTPSPSPCRQETTSTAVSPSRC